VRGRDGRGRGGSGQSGRACAKRWMRSEGGNGRRREGGRQSHRPAGGHRVRDAEHLYAAAAPRGRPPRRRDGGAMAGGRGRLATGAKSMAERHRCPCRTLVALACVRRAGWRGTGVEGLPARRKAWRSTSEAHIPKGVRPAVGVQWQMEALHPEMVKVLARRWPNRGEGPEDGPTEKTVSREACNSRTWTRVDQRKYRGNVQLSSLPTRSH